MSTPEKAGTPQSLNDFQKVMRQWAALAPYNCGPLMRVSGAPDLDRWRTAFAQTIRPLGLTNSKELPVEVSSLARDQTVAEQLNRAFDPGEIPVRAYVVPHDDDSHWFGVICDHWIADSRSLRALMQRVYASYAGAPSELPPLHFDQNQSSPSGGPVAQISALIAAARNYFRHYRAHRMPLRDPADFESDFLSLHFPPGSVERVRALAKQQRATVNDIFIATAAQVLGKFTAPQRALSRARFLRPRRDRVAIATAVDLRPRVAGTNDNLFGLALGYFSIITERPEERSLEELVAAVARETDAGKSNARALQLDWSLRIAHWLWNRASHPRARATLFQKGMPLAAGISNVNLTGSWADQSTSPKDEPRVLDYLRVSPVGPLLPIVFTLTTIGDRLSLCVTYRTTAFGRSDAEQIAAGFVERLSPS